MPVYVYRCRECGSTLERRQTFEETPLTICEACGGELRKVIQPVGVIFKGSGFYSTDYRDNVKSGHDQATKDAAANDTATSKVGEASTASKEAESSSPSKAGESTVSAPAAPAAPAPSAPPPAASSSAS